MALISHRRPSATTYYYINASWTILESNLLLSPLVAPWEEWPHWNWPCALSWGEAQRQSIYSDPQYIGGYYEKDAPPRSGLAAARMTALLTYRSRDSFETRFGRTHQGSTAVSPPVMSAWTLHNDGALKANSTDTDSTDGQPTIFTAQSYLRYQGEKFNSRFDANCYIHITRKMDTHDVARGRSSSTDPSVAVAEALSRIPPGALVISIQTDGLFTPSEQRELAAHIPEAELVVINSLDGHDGFLLEFEQINRHILGFLHKRAPEFFPKSDGFLEEAPEVDFEAKKTSMFGEAEVNVTLW